MLTKIITLSQKLILSIDFVFYLFAFLFPFALSGPQLLTGTAVNTMLYFASIKLKKRSWLLVSVLPSLGAFSHGVVFGPLTIFLFYFLPFIWISNLILMYIFRANRNIFLASAVKTVFLYITANIYYNFHIVPKIFVTSMGLFQFITAMVGGVAALILLKLNERNR